MNCRRMGWAGHVASKGDNFIGGFKWKKLTEIDRMEHPDVWKILRQTLEKLLLDDCRSDSQGTG